MLLDRVYVYSWKTGKGITRASLWLLICVSIYNACYAPLLCKRGMMKRILSLRNGNPVAPPPPGGYKCWWEVQQCTLGENPFHSNLVETAYLAFFHSVYFFYAIGGWTRIEGWRHWWKVLIIDVGSCLPSHCLYPSRALLQHICWLCKCSEVILALHAFVSALSMVKAKMQFIFLALQCSECAPTQVCACRVLILLSCFPQKWKCNCLDLLLFSLSLVPCLLLNRRRNQTKTQRKNCGARAAQLSSAAWVGLKYRVFLWGVGSMRITLPGSQAIRGSLPCWGVSVCSV